MRRYSSFLLIVINVISLAGCMHHRMVTVTPSNSTRQSATANPDSPTALSNFIQATLKISQENTAAAEESLKQLNKRRPELADLSKQVAQNASDVASRRLLAEAYLDEGLLPFAFQMYQEIQTIRPNDSVAELGVARVWDRWGDYNLAYQHAERAVVMDPGSAEALEALGRIHLHRNQTDQALSAFLSSLEINPLNASLMANVGYVLLQRGDLAQARRYLEHSIAIDDSIAESHNNLGIILARIGEPERALQQFLTVNEPPAAFNNLGVVYLSQKKWTQARAAFQRALGMDPGYKKAQANLAETEARMPRPTIVNLPGPKPAIEFAKKAALPAASDSANARSSHDSIKKESRITAAYSDALNRFRKRNYGEAIDILSWLLLQFPNDTLASNCEYWIGESYFGLADYKNAYLAFKRVTQYAGSPKKNDAVLMMRRATLKQHRTGKSNKA